MWMGVGLLLNNYQNYKYVNTLLRQLYTERCKDEDENIDQKTDNELME